MHDVFKLHECQYELRNKSQMVVPKYNTVIYGYNSLAVHGSLLRLCHTGAIFKANSLKTPKSAKNPIARWAF